jgi:hypothetical protein
LTEVTFFWLLLSINITHSLQITNEVMTESNSGFHSVPQLNITKMVKQVAHLQFSSFGHFHM